MATEADGRDLVLVVARQLREPKVAGWVLFFLVAFSVASVVLGLTLPEGGKWVGTLGSLLFPLLLGAWSVFDLVAQNFDKSRSTEQVELRLRAALNPVRRQLGRIAETPQKEWTHSRAKALQEDILECVATLLSEAGVPEPKGLPLSSELESVLDR